MHQLIVLGLDPPLRQGQTRYPFIVMQLKKDDEVQDMELNVTPEVLKRYEGKLEESYTMATHQALVRILRGLSGKKILEANRHVYKSHHEAFCIKCSIKASEGLLYPLDKCLLFVPKPATYVALEHVHMVTMSRVGGALAASRTFDIVVTMKGGQGEHQFSNINRYVNVHLNVSICLLEQRGATRTRRLLQVQEYSCEERNDR